LKFVRVGRAIRYRLSDVEEFLRLRALNPAMALQPRIIAAGLARIELGDEGTARSWWRNSSSGSEMATLGELAERGELAGWEKPGWGRDYMGRPRADDGVFPPGQVHHRRKARWGSYVPDLP
jgi:hypothetical protein